MVNPLVHEVVGGSGEEQGRVVGHCQLQGVLVATGVGQRHLEAGAELEDCLGSLWRGRGGSCDVFSWVVGVLGGWLLVF